MTLVVAFPAMPVSTDAGAVLMFSPTAPALPASQHSAELVLQAIYEFLQ